MLNPGFCDTSASKVEISVFSDFIWRELSHDLTDMTNLDRTEATVNAIHLELVVMIVDMLLHLRSTLCQSVHPFIEGPCAVILASENLLTVHVLLLPLSAQAPPKSVSAGLSTSLTELSIEGMCEILLFSLANDLVGDAYGQVVYGNVKLLCFHYVSV